MLATEADILSDLAFRSKAVWGYSEAFMEACRAELTVDPAPVPGRIVTVAVVQETSPLGFIDLRIADGIAQIEAYFVEPSAQGQGIGKALWNVLEEQATVHDVHTIRVEADPGAEGFYQAMGMEVTGRAASGSIPGRSLPVLEKKLSVD